MATNTHSNLPSAPKPRRSYGTSTAAYLLLRRRPRAGTTGKRPLTDHRLGRSHQRDLPQLPPPAPDASRWSARLGELAAAASAGPSSHPPASITAPPTPARLVAILGCLRNRAEVREHAAGKLRATEFLAGPP